MSTTANQDDKSLPDEPNVDCRENAHAALRNHVVFSQDWHYDIVLLWAAQPHLKEVLPDKCCVNLAFTGGKSSGKTTATEIANSVAEGKVLAGGTYAAVIRTFDSGKTVGIDELDSLVKRLPEIEDIIRQGNNWNAVYETCIKTKGGKWIPDDLKIGGPKVFNLRHRHAETERRPPWREQPLSCESNKSRYHLAQAHLW